MKTRLLRYTIYLFIILSALKPIKSLATDVTYTALAGNTATGFSQGSGATNLVVFGFQMDVPSNAPFSLSVQNFHINASQNLNGYISAKLVRVASANPSLAITNPLNTYNGNINPTLDFSAGSTYAAGSTSYFYLVVSVSNSSNPPGFSSVKFSLGTGTSDGKYNNVSPSPINVIDNLPTTSETFAVGLSFNWTGNSGTTWSTPQNWVDNANHTNNAPGAGDLAYIGVNQSFTNSPIVTGTTTVGAITFGNKNTSYNLTLNADLTVATDVTQTTANAIILNGAGSKQLIIKGALKLLSDLTINSTAGVDLTNSTTASTVTGITTISGGSLKLGSGSFAFSNGFDNTNGTITGGSGNITVGNGVRQFAGTGSITFGTGNVNFTTSIQLYGGTLTAGTGTLLFGNSVQVYSGATLTGGATPAIMTVTGIFQNYGTFSAGTGTINFKGSYENGNIFTYGAGNIFFNGTGTQTLTDNSTGGSTFNNVTFQGGGTKTMAGTGKFGVASTGALTMAASTILAAGGILTLKSDASGTGRVAVIPSGAQISGNVTVERWFTGGNLSNRGWRLMSSPVANNTGTYNFSSLQTNLYITGVGAGFDASPNNGATVLLYDTPNKKLISLPLITTPVKVGSGFYFYFRGNKTTTTGKLVKVGTDYAVPEANVVGLQTGTLNQQNITYTLSNAGSGFNLVGNPYASTITLPSGSGATAPYTGTTGFVYTYTSGANSVVAQPTAVNIASGQGFYVKSNNATSSIAFTESLKTNAQVTGSNLLLGKPIGTEQPILSIKMVQDSANYDIAHLRFLDTYKAEYDETEDADDFNGSGQNVFLGAMTIDNRQVAIASQPLNKKKTSVFLNVNDNYSGLYTIQKMNLSGIPELYDVWLMDHFKNDSLDLRANNTYKFNLDKANPLTFGAKRFEIVIRQKSLPPYALVSFNGQRTGTDVVLKWDTKNEFNYTSFELQRSIDGTNFEAVRNIQSSSQGAYSFKDIYVSNNTSTIYYRLKQVDVNDVVHYSAVITITAAKGNGTFAVFPNPATNTIQFSLDQTLKSPSVRLSIFNTMGLLMKSSTFTATTGQQDVSTLIPGNYTIEITDLGTKKAILTGKFIKL